MGNKKVDLTVFFELGINVEDLTEIKPTMLRNIAYELNNLRNRHSKWSNWSLERLVECIAKIEADKKPTKTCKTLMVKLSKFARRELINVYDYQMCDIRNRQREARQDMEKLKKVIDRYTPLDVYCEEEDKNEKILRNGSVIELNPKVIPQC